MNTTKRVIAIGFVLAVCAVALTPSATAWTVVGTGTKFCDSGAAVATNCTYCRGYSDSYCRDHPEYQFVCQYMVLGNCILQ
jgi:hypothetical protein